MLPFSSRTQSAPARRAAPAPSPRPLAASAARGHARATQVRVSTNMGDFVIELRTERAPLTTANFLRYVREGFYSDTLFHRVVAELRHPGRRSRRRHLEPQSRPRQRLQRIRQRPAEQARHGGPGAQRSAAFGQLAVLRRTWSTTRTSIPVPTRWGYTVFGRVVQGMDVVDRIGETRHRRDRPLQVRCAVEARHHRKDGDHRAPAAPPPRAGHHAGDPDPKPGQHPLAEVVTHGAPVRFGCAPGRERARGQRAVSRLPAA